MIKMPAILIITIFLIFFIIITSYFWGFEEWKKQTWGGLSIFTILNTLGICIFVIFGILKILRCIFPKLNKYFTSNIKYDLAYILISCIIWTLIIPIVISNMPFTVFLLRYSITSFIYLFGVATICIKIFS
ncbi:hypothetical protein ES708_22889 [subsurface metagenome]